jgi:hypothetical protein
MAFRVFVVGKSLNDNHIGEEYDFIHEVPDQFCFESAPEHALLLRGVVRSGFYDYSKDVEVITDFHSSWDVMIEDLKVVMKEEEGIEFTVTKGVNNV